MPMWRRQRSATTPVDALVEACENGLDLPAVMAAACAAVSMTLSGAVAEAYVLTEDGANLRLVSGEGPDELDAPEPEGARAHRRPLADPADQRPPHASAASSPTPRPTPT